MSATFLLSGRGLANRQTVPRELCAPNAARLPSPAENRVVAGRRRERGLAQRDAANSGASSIGRLTPRKATARYPPADSLGGTCLHLKEVSRTEARGDQLTPKSLIDSDGHGVVHKPGALGSPGACGPLPDPGSTRYTTERFARLLFERRRDRLDGHHGESHRIISKLRVKGSGLSLPLSIGRDTTKWAST
ncbi:hypothetical protein V5799_005714 [Amblyomma americanum]|uniref:Uncharacterized protein n=1 Tax=Amblyomma americanum TaxID=6943 RepID=A0AAQ4DYG9_AMBAM